MISIRRMPIRQKLILMMLCTGIAAVLLVSTAFIGYEMSTYRQRLLDEAATLAKIIADRSNTALLFGDARLLQDNLDSLALHGSIEVACIYAADDNVVARFLRNSRALCPGNPRDLPNQNPLGLLNLSEPVMLDGDVLGHLYLGANQSELRRHLRNYLLTALGVISLVIFVVWQLSHRLQRVVSAPIHHLVETANEIAGNHNYQLRAYKESEDEIGTLVEAFNSMLDTID
ncbi:MAG: HAMP domain-containing protein, partial [Gammaproteobacteria bacterium]|nr:HAMP domain-containing protein [Gammaproteobacteria bacterium]